VCLVLAENATNTLTRSCGTKEARNNIAIPRAPLQLSTEIVTGRTLTLHFLAHLLCACTCTAHEMCGKRLRIGSLRVAGLFPIILRPRGEPRGFQSADQNLRFRSTLHNFVRLWWLLNHQYNSRSEGVSLLGLRPLMPEIIIYQKPPRSRIQGRQPKN